MLGASELNVSAGGVAEGVFKLCLFPVTVAIVQQSVRKWAAAAWTSRSGAVGSNGAESGGGTDGRSAGGGVEVIGARRPGEVVEPRRAERGGGDVRSGGDAAAADAVNPLWAAVR